MEKFATRPWRSSVNARARYSMCSAGYIDGFFRIACYAACDIRELRGLLDAWRDARRTAWQTVVKVLTTGLLMALLVGAAIKFKVYGGGQ